MIDKPVDGVHVEERPHPGGKKGAMLSLDETAERAWKARMSPRLRAWVGQQLRDGGNPKGRRDQAQLVLDAFRKKVTYAPDPVMGEFMATPDQTLCLDEGGLCMLIGDCFPEGTLLLRDDFAFVPIEEIKVGDRIWGHNKWSLVTEKWFKGELLVDAIEMNNGSTMYLTGDHKVYVGQCKHGARCEMAGCKQVYLRTETFDRIHVSDLREGDTLLQPERINFGSGNVDAGRMYIEGLALADGWTQATANSELPPISIRIAGRDGMRKEAQKHEVKAICERLGIETVWHPRYITIKDRQWASHIASLGSRARFKHLETINLDEATATEALRGVMADSTANTFGLSRTFSTTSRMLMLQVRVLHRMFGQFTSVRMLTPEQHGGAGKHPLWRVGQRTKGNGTNLFVRSVEHAVRKVPCWDISTDDHYVYLPEHDVTVSNCDDAAITLAAAMMSIGIPAMIVGSSHRDPVDTPTHVYMAFQDEQGDWVRMDGTTKHPVGRTAPAKQEFWVEPGENAKDRGEGDFLGMTSKEVGVSGVGGVQTASRFRENLKYPYFK